MGKDQTHTPCQHRKLWNSILVHIINVICNFDAKLNLNHITQLYSCHKAIYWTNESRSFSLKNQLGAHVERDVTNCDATFCPCPTYTSMLFREKNLAHKQESCTKDVPLLFLYKDGLSCLSLSSFALALSGCDLLKATQLGSALSVSFLSFCLALHIDERRQQ